MNGFFFVIVILITGCSQPPSSEQLALETKRTQMEAEYSVLQDVVATFPRREHINVRQYALLQANILEVAYLRYFGKPMPHQKRPLGVFASGDHRVSPFIVSSP